MRTGKQKKILKHNEAGKNGNNHRLFSNQLMTFQGTYCHQVAVQPAYKS